MKTLSPKPPRPFLLLPIVTVSKPISRSPSPDYINRCHHHRPGYIAGLPHRLHLRSRKPRRISPPSPVPEPTRRALQSPISSTTRIPHSDPVFNLCPFPRCRRHPDLVARLTTTASAASSPPTPVFFSAEIPLRIPPPVSHLVPGSATTSDHSSGFPPSSPAPFTRHLLFPSSPTFHAFNGAKIAAAYVPYFRSPTADSGCIVGSTIIADSGLSSPTPPVPLRSHRLSVGSACRDPFATIRGRDPPFRPGFCVVPRSLHPLPTRT